MTKYSLNRILAFLLLLLAGGHEVIANTEHLHKEYFFKPKSQHSIELDLAQNDDRVRSANYGYIAFNDRDDSSIITISFDDENCTLQKNVRVQYLTHEGLHYEYFEKFVMDGESLLVSYIPVKLGWGSYEVLLEINGKEIQFKPKRFPKNLVVDDESSYLNIKTVSGAIREKRK